MFVFPDQLVELQRQSLQSAQAIAMASFAGFEKLAQLNVQAAKASVEESVQRSMSLLEMKDVKEVTETIAQSAKPPGDKFTAYAKHVYDIASETRAEISEVLEKQFSESNRQLTASLEAMAKNSPVGSEGVVTMVKSAITAANATWDQVNKASRKVAETTDANVTNATNEVLTAALTSSSSQARR
jgi:phasin family protein